MPLPLIPVILTGVSAVIGAKGVKDGVDAKKNIKEAEGINDVAKKISNEAEEFIEMAKGKTRESIEALGHEKIRILSSSINDFVVNFEKIKDVNLKKSQGIDELMNFSVSSNEFIALKKSSFEAKDIAVNGLAAIGSGALLAYGTYSVVMGGLGGLIVTATTGASIGTLSGVVATNATLAWLGGGALSVGGLGMSGGMVVLGGLAFGPALAVGGAIFASQSRKALNDSYCNYDKAKAFKSQAKNIGTALKGIFNRANQIKELLNQLDSYLVRYTDKMKSIIERKGSRWEDYSQEEKQYIYICVQIAQTIKAILDTSLLNENGELEEKTTEVLKNGNMYLEKMNRI